jgi:hypothetical protein
LPWSHKYLNSRHIRQSQNASQVLYQDAAPEECPVSLDTAVKGGYWNLIGHQSLLNFKPPQPLARRRAIPPKPDRISCRKQCSQPSQTWRPRHPTGQARGALCRSDSERSRMSVRISRLCVGCASFRFVPEWNHLRSYIYCEHILRSSNPAIPGQGGSSLRCVFHGLSTRRFKKWPATPLREAFVSQCRHGQTPKSGISSVIT